jgi:hypothetical protein
MKDRVPPASRSGHRPQRRPVAGGRASRRRGSRADDPVITSNLPERLPVAPGEADLVRIYFADLIAGVLKASS